MSDVDNKPLVSTDMDEYRRVLAEFTKREAVLVAALLPHIVSGDWEYVARNADHVIAHAVNEDEDWIWKQIGDITTVDDEWNICSFGNVAYCIVHGKANRIDLISAVKDVVTRYATDQ